jgi:hypothetical protein
MIIETPTGRRRSIVTEEELQSDLLKRINNLNKEERFWLDQILDEIRQMAEDGEDGYESSDEMASMAMMFRKYLHLHYEEPIIPVREFCLSKRYFGHVGEYFYETWMDDLVELNSRPYNEAILTGSIGSGKTTFADMGLAYMFYELCMLKDPQSTFGLMPGSEIVLVCFNRDQQLAREVTFGGFKRKIEVSPFFKDLGIRIGTSIVEYQKKNIKVIPISAKSANALGRDVFGGVLDETDFIDGSIINDVQDKPGEKSFVEKLHESITRRMKSRFDRAGVLPGKLFMTSSARHKQSYTNRRIGAAATNPMVFCRDYAIYEVAPRDRFSPDRFWVRVGNERIPHKVLSKKEYRGMGSSGRRRLEAQGCRFIRVPMNFRSDFDRNIEDSIRDIAGVVTVSIAPFFQLRSRIYEITDTTLASPVYVDEWCTSEPLEIKWDRLSQRHRRRIGPGEYIEELRPRRHPDAPRFVHLDLSLGLSDPAGICIAHVVDYITMERRSEEGEPFKEEVPLIEVDLVLRIIAPTIGEIDFGEIRGLIYAFQKHGYTLSFASMDSFQSRDMLQQLSAKGIDGEIISVDKTIDPYTCFKTAVYEGRISVYDYQILIQEMEQLVRDDNKGKVDHPPNGCFVESTRIPLLDGTCAQISELDGVEEWVYASRDDGSIVPGKARGRLTGYTRELVDVVLDSGAVERCTPEHLWRMWDGSYKMAKDLTPGIDRLMPINRNWPVNGGYESVSDKNGKKTLTHHLVHGAINGEFPSETEIVHHKNGIKTDNRPWNLEIIKRSKHSRKHTVKRHKEDRQYRASLSNGLKMFNESERGRRLHSEHMKSIHAQKTKEDWKLSQRKNPWFRHDVTEDKLRSVAGQPNANAAARALGCGRNVVMRVLKDLGAKSWLDFQDNYAGENHKVRYVIPVLLKDAVPVYDLEVDEYSNFALSSGVFVHNSKDTADAVCGAVYALTTKHVFRAPMAEGISEYVDHEDKDSEWIRQTMEKKGDRAPVEIKNDYDGPVFFTG